MSAQHQTSYALDKCRACKGETRRFLNLGQSPVANRLLSDPAEPVESHPLGLARCSTCGLVQNSTCLPSGALFGAEYAYLSSVSAAVKDNCRDLANRVSDQLSPDARVLDVGSNDGTLQRAFRTRGIECFGVDPSAIPVEHARQAGLTAFCCEFDAATARQLTQSYGRFSAITMSNVLAHVADPLAMLEAARMLLDHDTGLLVIEVQSWQDLVRLGAFDMVYHEHHSHFSLGSLAALLTAASFSVFDVQQIKTQGGSLRLWCRPGGAHAASVRTMIDDEAVALVSDESEMNAALLSCRDSVTNLLHAAEGRHIAGYGAAAKTVTLLAALGSDLGIRRIADNAPTKVGKYLPCHAIPIVPPRQLLDTDADIVLVFAWNLLDEILPELEGREVWIPFPEFRRVQ